MSQPVYQEPKNVIGSGIPFVVSPTGSVAANGVVTIGTALPTTFLGGAYVYYPAGAVFAGSAAGWYWTVMSSTTVGVIYNNVYVSGAPSAPFPLTPVVAAGPGAYTGVTTAVVGPSIQLPVANILGLTSAIRLTLSSAYTNSANNKTVAASLGGTSIFSKVVTTTLSSVDQAIGFNQNSQALQATSAAAAAGGLGAVATAQTYNTGANFASQTNPPTLAVTLTLSTATEYLVLTGFLAELFALG